MADVNPLSHRYYLADIERSLRVRPASRKALRRWRATVLLGRVLAGLRGFHPARETA